MHRAVVRMGSNRTATTVLRYDPAGSYRMKVLWREDMLHQVPDIIMVIRIGDQYLAKFRVVHRYQLMNFFWSGAY